MGSVRKEFVDKNTNVILAYATLPEEFNTSASVDNKWQSDAVPFTCWTNAFSPDGSVLLYSGSKQQYEDFKNKFVKSIASKDPNTIKTGLRDFIEPEAFMKQFAETLTQSQVKAIGRCKLPSYFGQDLNRSTNNYVNWFYTHAININVKLEIANAYCDAILIKYKATFNNKEVIVLVGMDYQGIEYYDANNGMAMVGGLLGGLFGNKNNNSATNGPIKFGHSKEAGKQVDSIIWGYDRIYALITPVEKEEESTKAFVNFVSSFTVDTNVQQRFNSLVEQRHQQNVQIASNNAMMANNMRMQAMQSQANLTRQLQQNSESISAGIMDSWDKSSASQSRMSENYSEAIRGVNTYTTSSGKTVEFDNVADHVYMDKYGDRWGVSGTGLDQSDLNNLDWVELNKK